MANPTELMDLTKMIFVFGSNLSGIHGAGAAKYALYQKGAMRGIGEGLMGMSYALPTKGLKIAFMPATIIKEHVDKFIRLAKRSPGLKFQITQIGCGLSGFTPKDMAPLFVDAPDNCYFDLAWEEFLPVNLGFWGTVPKWG